MLLTWETCKSRSGVLADASRLYCGPSAGLSNTDSAGALKRVNSTASRVREDEARDGATLLQVIMRFLRPSRTETVCWLSRDLAIGCPASRDQWLALRDEGVRAVVDLSDDAGDLPALLRRCGLRYLHLRVANFNLPREEEIHIVTSWALQRIGDGGAVLLCESEDRANDALLACAILVKRGASALKAHAQLRGATGLELAQVQLDLLERFAAQQPQPSEP